MVSSLLAGLLLAQAGGSPAPKVGAMAPDVAFEAIDSAKRFRVSDRRGKRPLVLIFGSCT